jgi:hypothetical protein
MRRNVPYAIIIPIFVVCFAVVLMFWAMQGTNGGRGEIQAGQTTGSANIRSNAEPVAAPTTPSNDTAADSARTPNSPLNKSR